MHTKELGAISTSVRRRYSAQLNFHIVTRLSPSRESSLSMPASASHSIRSARVPQSPQLNELASYQINLSKDPTVTRSLCVTEYFPDSAKGRENASQMTLGDFTRGYEKIFKGQEFPLTRLKEMKGLKAVKLDLFHKTCILYGESHETAEMSSFASIAEVPVILNEMVWNRTSFRRSIM